jgi:hypothetical protein
MFFKKTNKMETNEQQEKLGQENGRQQSQQQQEQGNYQQSLPSDGPVSNQEGDDGPDLDERDTPKSFDRDQEQLDLGLRDGDLDTGIVDDDKQ